jgi:molybdopterin adenylyltransferase
MIRVAVVTISDSSAAGIREDRSGPALEARAVELGWMVIAKRLLPDDADAIAEVLAALSDGGSVDVILTTGGTGVSPRDVTPEAAARIAEKHIPGFGEVMRWEGRKSTKVAAISRGGAVTRGATLIVTVPGSPKGALESLNATADLIPHVVDLLHGRTSHDPKLSS